jgi:plasmid stability protein
MRQGAPRRAGRSALAGGRDRRRILQEWIKQFHARIAADLAANSGRRQETVNNRYPYSYQLRREIKHSL